jgi:hypothetical protein
VNEVFFYKYFNIKTTHFSAESVAKSMLLNPRGELFHCSRTKEIIGITLREFDQALVILPIINIMVE